MNPVIVHAGDGPVVLGLPHTGTHVPEDIYRHLTPVGLATRGWSATTRAASAQRSAPSAQRVPQLLASLNSGSKVRRDRARQELTALYYRYPDPGPTVAGRLLGRDEEGLPSTARGWEAWWDRVEPTVGGLAQR